MIDFVSTIKKLGFSDKAAKVYLAALELGEATVQELANRSKVKRTSIYYVLDELLERGAIISTKRNRKQYFIPEDPRVLVKLFRERMTEYEDAVPALEDRKHAVYHRPRTLFFYGPSGFKKVWDMILESGMDEYCITTSGESFLDFVKEKYIIDEIIKKKRGLGIESRQIITDSPYARKIVAKDMQENRSSRFLSPRYPMVFTEVVCGSYVAYISPRIDNLIMVIENNSFAKTRLAAFELLWEGSSRMVK